jgi:hypothetical protein
MKRLQIALLTSLALVAGACASMGNRTDYAAYAGDPVPEIRYTQLYNWQRTGDRSLVVWTKPSTAYLMTLRHDCAELIGNTQIQIGGVDGIDGRIQAGFGEVKVGQLKCRIDTIQPLDMARLRADQGLARR